LRYLILLLMACSFVGASLFDDWVTTGENITAGGTVYTVYASGDAILLESSTIRVVVPLDYVIIKNGLEFSYLGYQSDYEDYLEKHNISGVHSGFAGNTTYHLVIGKPAPAITIEKELSRDELAVKDELDIEITIKNTGDLRVLGTYEEMLPPYLTKIGPLIVVRDDSDAEYNSQGVDLNWHGNIAQGETIKLLQPVQLAGSLSTSKVAMKKGFFRYDYMEESFTVRTNPITADYIYPLALKFSLPETIDVGEKQEVEITLQNLREKPIKVSRMQIMLPEHIKLEKADSRLRQLSWSGDVTNITSFILSIRPLYTGNMTIAANISSVYFGYPHTGVYTGSAIAEIDKPTAVFNIPDNVQSNGDANISFKMDNEGAYQYTGVQVNISSELFNDQKYLFADFTDILSKEFSFRAPWASEDIEFPTIVSYRYTSEYGEAFGYEFNKSITVMGLDFSPEVLLYIINSSWDNTSGNLTIEFSANRTNESVSQSTAIISVGGNVRYISLGFDNWTYSAVFNMGNMSPSSVDYMLNYKLENDTYFLSGQLELPLEGIPKPDQPPAVNLIENQSADSPVHIGGSGGTEGFADNALAYIDESNLSIESGRIDFRMAVALIIAVLAVFFVIIAAIYSSRHKIHKSHMHRSEATEQLLDKKQVKTIDAEEVIESVPATTSDLSVLEGHITKMTAKGEPKEKIKKDLMAIGWLEDIIEVFLK